MSLRALSCLLSLILLSGCATGRASRDGSCVITAKPTPQKQPISWHVLNVTLRHLLSVSHLLPLGSTGDRVDGVVADSAFFTNRSVGTLSPEAVRNGPTPSSQRPLPPFTVTRLKDEGKTAGFFVTDAAGARFLFKLDLVDQPELVTGAEVVTSKLLHALGYYVPSYEIVTFHPQEVTVSPTAHVEAEDLQELLAPRLRQGQVRASASRIVDGQILGPFQFQRFRSCACLRALKLAYAWVNNTDAKDHNTLMVWTGDRAIGYLIDFGSAFGADADHGPKGPCQGWLYDVDLANWTVEALTLGLARNGCDHREQPWSSAVGLFSPRCDPRRWKPYVPNLAFDAMSLADAQWMATRLAALSHAQLEAAVAAGHYGRSEDARRILEVLEARRAAILQVYASATVPEVYPGRHLEPSQPLEHPSSVPIPRMGR